MDFYRENGHGAVNGSALTKELPLDKKGKLNGSFSHQADNTNGPVQGLERNSYKDLLPWNQNTAVTSQFIQEMVEVLKKHIFASFNRDSKVIDYNTPEELMRKIDCELNDHSASLEDLIGITKKVLEHTVKAGHPRFFNQLFAGLDITGLMAQWATTAASTSMYTFEMAPVFLLMEQSVLKEFKKLVGFADGDGLLFPEFTLKKTTATRLLWLLMGHNCCLRRVRLMWYRPNLKEDGLYGQSRLTVFMSEEAHYSTTKAAATLGLGTKSVIKVKTDKSGKMIPEELHAKILESRSKGETPFYVCATSGTTVAGAFDSLPEIADICAEFNLWLHVDAAWGGSVLLSKKHKHLMRGIERADSVTWNPHKMMSVPFQCSMLLVKQPGLLQDCNKHGAKYLFQKDKKLYDVSWDTGDMTFQCGRHNDIFKLWLMWKAKGNKGFEEHVDKAFENSRYLAAQIKKRRNFELLMEPECTNVCFRYVPPSIDAMADGSEKLQRLHQVPPEIKKRMTLKGTMMIGYQPLKDLGNFFRMVVVSAAVTHSDMDFVLDEIERLGNDL